MLFHYKSNLKIYLCNTCFMYKICTDQYLMNRITDCFSLLQYSALSTLSNISRLQSYMFRTYNLPPGVYSMYPGSCKHRVWECIRASSAAPGFYKPFVLDEYIHQVISSTSPGIRLGR